MKFEQNRISLKENEVYWCAQKLLLPYLNGRKGIFIHQQQTSLPNLFLILGRLQIKESKAEQMNYEINKCITGHWACPRPHGKYTEIYPPTFLQRLETLLGPWTDKKILHLFCGSSKFGDVRIDINPEVKPDYILDLSRDELPCEDSTFDIIVADPPYHDFKPYSFVKEAVRVLKPLGFLVILHFLVYIVPKGCKRWACISVGCGPNTRMRALNIFRKELVQANIES